MVLMEKTAIKLIEEVINFNDYEKIIQVLNKINPNLFEERFIQDQFKEILANMYNEQNAEYVKSLLKEFLRDYYNRRGVHHNWFCSKTFIDKINSKHLSNIHRNKVLEQIRKITLGELDRIKIGDLYESPHGKHYEIRVFWYETREGKFIVDFFFKGNSEIENFYKRLKRNMITRDSYRNYAFLEDNINLEVS